MISHFANAFGHLVVREGAKLRAVEVASKAFDDPDNAASFHVERSPLPLKGSAADVSDEPHRPNWPLLFKGRANSMNASQYAWNGREPSTTASQLGKTNIGGAVSSARVSRTITSMAGVNSNLNPS